MGQFLIYLNILLLKTLKFCRIINSSYFNYLMIYLEFSIKSTKNRINYLNSTGTLDNLGLIPSEREWDIEKPSEVSLNDYCYSFPKKKNIQFIN